MTAPPLVAHEYRRLSPAQRQVVDEWLDRQGIHKATLIKALPDGRTQVKVYDETREELRDLVVSAEPFPWAAVRG